MILQQWWIQNRLFTTWNHYLDHLSANDFFFSNFEFLEYPNCEHQIKREAGMVS